MEGNGGERRNSSAEIGLLDGPLVDGWEGNHRSESRLPKSAEKEAF
jgi:hypothetical protein